MSRYATPTAPPRGVTRPAADTGQEVRDVVALG